jgi:hypothetical protein
MCSDEPPPGSTETTSTCDTYFDDDLEFGGTSPQCLGLCEARGWVVHTRVRRTLPRLRASTVQQLESALRYGRAGSVLFCFADFGGRSDVVDGYSVIESVSVALDHVRSPRACAALAFSATLDGAQASSAAEAGPATGGSRAAARLSAALGFAEDGELDSNVLDVDAVPAETQAAKDGVAIHFMQHKTNYKAFVPMKQMAPRFSSLVLEQAPDGFPDWSMSLTAPSARLSYNTSSPAQQLSYGTYSRPDEGRIQHTSHEAYWEWRTSSQRHLQQAPALGSNVNPMTQASLTQLQNTHRVRGTWMRAHPTVVQQREEKLTERLQALVITLVPQVLVPTLPLGSLQIAPGFSGSPSTTAEPSATFITAEGAMHAHDGNCASAPSAGRRGGLASAQRERTRGWLTQRDALNHGALAPFGAQTARAALRTAPGAVGPIPPPLPPVRPLFVGPKLYVPVDATRPRPSLLTVKRMRQSRRFLEEPDARLPTGAWRRPSHALPAAQDVERHDYLAEMPLLPPEDIQLLTAYFAKLEHEDMWHWAPVGPVDAAAPVQRAQGTTVLEQWKAELVDVSEPAVQLLSTLRFFRDHATGADLSATQSARGRSAVASLTRTLAEGARLRRFGPHEPVFHEGEVAHSFFVLLAGSLQREQWVCNLKAGHRACVHARDHLLRMVQRTSHSGRATHAAKHAAARDALSEGALVFHPMRGFGMVSSIATDDTANPVVVVYSASKETHRYCHRSAMKLLVVDRHKISSEMKRINAATDVDDASPLTSTNASGSTPKSPADAKPGAGRPRRASVHALTQPSAHGSGSHGAEGARGAVSGAEAAAGLTELLPEVVVGMALVHLSRGTCVLVDVGNVSNNGTRDRPYIVNFDSGQKGVAFRELTEFEFVLPEAHAQLRSASERLRSTLATDASLIELPVVELGDSVGFAHPADVDGAEVVLRTCTVHAKGEVLLMEIDYADYVTVAAAHSRLAEQLALPFLGRLAPFARCARACVWCMAGYVLHVVCSIIGAPRRRSRGSIAKCTRCTFA